MPRTGPAADLGATLSVRRLQERWEKADSERQISEEEKSKRLAQGQWKKIFLKKERNFFYTQGQQQTLIIRLIWPHTNSSKRIKIMDAACTLRSMQKLVFCWEKTEHVIEFIKEKITLSSGKRQG